MKNKFKKPLGWFVTGIFLTALGFGAGWVMSLGKPAKPAKGAPTSKIPGIDLIVPGVEILGIVIAVLSLLVLVARLSRLRHRSRTGQYGDDGWASAWALWRRVSPTALRWAPGKGRTQRRALRESMPWWKWARVSPKQLGSLVGKTVVGPSRPRPVYTAIADVVEIIAPPQSGKSAMLGNWVLDAPGPVVTTSTKPDVFEHTHRLRNKVGTVLVFNPYGVGGIPSTFRWSPVSGCADSRVAEARAAAMVTGARAASSLQDAGFWEQQCVKVLKCFLLAAAVSGGSMVDVARWVSNPASKEAMQILTHSKGIPTGWAAELEQILSTEAKRTRDSVFITLASAVGFMQDPALAKIATPGPGEVDFDAEDFMAARNTLYLIGGETSTLVGPLFAALTTYIFDTARAMAANQPGNRLKNPLLLALDEVALICPVPLERWVADCGGRAIQLVYAAQAPRQLTMVFGRDARSVIEVASNTKITLGGLTDPEDLEAISRMAGERTQVSETSTEDSDGTKTSKSVSERETRIISPAAIRQIPQWRALVVYRDMAPTIVKFSPVWERRDVKRSKKSPAPTLRPLQARTPEPVAPVATQAPVPPPVFEPVQQQPPRPIAEPAPWERFGGGR